MWEPDRKLYALLLFVWAFLLVASLATVSPEVFRMEQSELMRLARVSDLLEKMNGEMSSELQNWKQNSQALEIELENSSLEISSLLNEKNAQLLELNVQKVQLTELGKKLENSETQASEWKQQSMESEARLANSEQSLKLLAKDLSRLKTERNIWRIAAMVAGILAATGWTMILWWP